MIENYSQINIDISRPILEYNENVEYGLNRIPYYIKDNIIYKAKEDDSITGVFDKTKWTELIASELNIQVCNLDNGLGGTGKKLWWRTELNHPSDNRKFRFSIIDASGGSSDIYAMFLVTVKL